MLLQYINKKSFTGLALLGILLSPLAQADIISTTQATATDAPKALGAQSEQDRALVKDFLNRQKVQEQLQQLGVAKLITPERVASLSNSEVELIANKIRQMPAGGNLSNLSNADIIIILLVIIVIVLIL
jgi:hypothetical protein